MKTLFEYKEMSLCIALAMYPTIKELLGDEESDELMSDNNHIARVLCTPKGDLLRFQICSLEEDPRQNRQQSLLIRK